jgi:hypothetical protein
MKKNYLTTPAAILACFFICGLSAGQEISEAGPVESHPLKIAIVGTARYQDTNFIVSNLKRSPQILEISVSTSGRDLIELSGRYSGPPDSLIEEITGLAQERFTVEIEKRKRSPSRDSLSITLKKIAP